MSVHGLSGAVITYAPPATATSASDCASCQVPNGQPITTRVGPLAVTTVAPCRILARVGGFAFAVPCAVTITNRGERPVALVAQNQSGDNLSAAFDNVQRGRGLRAMIASLPTTLAVSSFTVDILGPVRLDPGQSVSLPQPPATGSATGYWTVIDIDPQAIQRAAWVAGGAAAVVGGGLVYGAVKGIQAIAGRRRRR